MESQEKIHVATFTGINKDIFLQEIYPQVRRNSSTLCFLWGNMCSHISRHISITAVLRTIRVILWVMCVARF